MKPIKLEQWSIIYPPNSNPYTPPEFKRAVLHGKVFGHSHYPDGKLISTSYIIRVSEEKYVHTKSGTVYELGEVNPRYEQAYPGARKRLFSIGRK